MSIPSSRLISILCLSAIAATATAQDAAPAPRDARAEIEVLDRGTGTPVLLRWRTKATDPVSVQVTTRTVPAAVESPGLDDTEPDVRLAGLLRPPTRRPGRCRAASIARTTMLGSPAASRRDGG